MFDYVEANMQLPGIKEKPPVVLQTKDLKRYLDHYRITCEGLLFRNEIGHKAYRRVRKNLNFVAYTFVGEEHQLTYWSFKFKLGKLTSVRKLKR